jgi:hypothetical protein
MNPTGARRALHKGRVNAQHTRRAHGRHARTHPCSLRISRTNPLVRLLLSVRHSLRARGRQPGCGPRRGKRVHDHTDRAARDGLVRDGLAALALIPARLACRQRKLQYTYLRGEPHPAERALEHVLRHARAPRLFHDRPEGRVQVRVRRAAAWWRSDAPAVPERAHAPRAATRMSCGLPEQRSRRRRTRTAYAVRLAVHGALLRVVRALLLLDLRPLRRASARARSAGMGDTPCCVRKGMARSC